MPVIKRTQPRTLLYKPAYQLGSRAAQLARRGLSAKQIDAVHPLPVIRGAAHTRTRQTPTASRPGFGSPPPRLQRGS